jgi:hypothetical protein
MLTDLADACRATGLTVVETPGWKTRGHGPMTSVQTILCHHTAGPKNGELPSLATVRDGRPDLAGPLAHLMLGRSGTVYVIAAGLCWHAGVVFDSSQANEHAIGIEAEATGVDPWPLVQYDAYARLTAGLAKHYGLSVARVLGHKEVASPRGRKSDPNFDMPAFRAKVNNTPAGVGVAPVPKPHYPEDDPVNIELVWSDDHLSFRGVVGAEAGPNSALYEGGWLKASPAWGGCHIKFTALRAGAVMPGQSETSVANNAVATFNLPAGCESATVEGTVDTRTTLLSALWLPDPR